MGDFKLIARQESMKKIITSHDHIRVVRSAKSSTMSSLQLKTLGS